MTFISYAQNFEDVLLWRALNHVKNGFYIDVGASHPDIDSVTRAFYDRNWRGINVEPNAAAHQRLSAARPRDVNLRLALGSAPGTSMFYSVEDANSGLSTLDPGAVERYEALGMAVRVTTIETDTLAAVCQAHAVPEIHFLKVDVEGAERAVLAGADFVAYRPWIVLAEATAPMSTVETHADWEPILFGADYIFVWFDGLNRYYVARERHAQLEQAFRSPPNVFDDFLRAADTEWTRRLSQAEAQIEAISAQAIGSDLRAAVAEDRSQDANLRLLRAGAEIVRLRTTAAHEAARTSMLEANLASAQAHQAHQADNAAMLDAMRASTSWRLTRPLRLAKGRWQARAIPPGADSSPPALPPEHNATEPLSPATPAALAPRAAQPARTGLRAVHQFHSGTASGDAITNAMFLTRKLLRSLGYDSRIFAEHLDPALGEEIHPFTDLPAAGAYVLILRHSMGHDQVDRLLALEAPKILMYHNITPAELLEDMPCMQQFAVRGREQLVAIRPAVATALADSEYNAIELRRLGYDSVAASMLLFDLDALLAQGGSDGNVPAAAGNKRVLTILFVGRVTASKNQVGLVVAYAKFRALYRGESRLVLVGRHDAAAYLDKLLATIRRLGLDTGAVEVTGQVSDEELHRRFREADLYVSASLHEGFGVPLIEAMAHGLPVLALGAGAIPYTAAPNAKVLDPDTAAVPPPWGTGVLADTTAASLTAAMLGLAKDPAARADLARRQRTSIERFSLARQTPALVTALMRAGAAAPVDAAALDALAAHACFTVAGHVNGTYSLAEVNRSLALALDAQRPGAVRLVPIEGDFTSDTNRIPADQAGSVAALLARPAPSSGPSVVISQHYPVWIPPEPGDVPLALFFWEETLVPAATVAALNSGFRGVLAPSRVVAKALIDSGLRIPVRVVGLEPRLSPFRRVHEARAARLGTGPFTFLHVSSGFPRKGVDVLLAAWAQAFRAGDGVHLVIKVFPNPHNTVAADLARHQAEDAGMAPVTLIDADVGTDALLALYGQADAMVLPSRGEGYNLPAAEALEAGLPLIVTGWGGHLDMLPNDPAVRRLGFRFARSGSHLASPFSLWAEPDLDDLVRALQEMRHRGLDWKRTLPPIASAPVADLAGRIARFAAELLLAPRDAASPRTAWVTTWDVRCGIAEYTRHLLGAMPPGGVVLADHRTPAATNVTLTIDPAWRVGDPDGPHTLPGAILRHDPQAVIFQHQPGLIAWSALAPLLGHPAFHGRVVCITLHNTQDLADAPAEVRAAVVAALGRVSRVVVHTVHDLNILVGLGLAANTTMIPHGAKRSGAKRSGAAAKLRLLAPHQDVRLGCYGFFLPGKGIPQLIEALAILRRDWPHATLSLVNAQYPAVQSSEEIACCRRLVAKLGLGEAVSFETGFLEHSRSEELLSNCDLVVLPYQQSKEGSSAALRTALHTGVPVAVTDLPLLDEAGPAAVRLPGATPAAIAAGIDLALRDSAVRSEAAAAAIDWLADRSWDVIGLRWQAMLDALWASRVVVPER